MRRPLSILLSVVAGLLIGFPAMLTMHPAAGVPLLLLFAGVGGRIGYLRGESAGFFYFVLICDLILISLISRGSSG